MSGDGRSSGYADVRQALLDKGYLEHPLERLFLHGVGDPLGRSLRARLGSALIAGALAGPLLGVLLAGVLVAQARGLVALWPDAVLYAVLFSLVLGVIVAVAEAVVGVVLRAFGRVGRGLSPRRASLLAGLSVSGVLALYLGFWWVRTGGALSAPDLAALLALAVGAGLAGRVVSAAALVDAALTFGRAPRRRRPRLLLVLVGAAIGAAAVAALGAALATHESTGAPVAVRADAPRRTVFVAWDGLSREIEQGLRRAAPPGRRLFSDGDADVVSAVTDIPAGDPVAVWTTVATGAEPAEHGVGSVELRALAGAADPIPRAGLAAGPLHLVERLWPTERRAIRAGVRRIPAFWEVAADVRKTAVIGWWATWPAMAPGRAGGYVVSDGALAALRSGRAAGPAIHPASWGEARSAVWLKDAEHLADAAGAGAPSPDKLAREALIVDLFALEALRDVLRDPDLSMVTVYLPGLDILRAGRRRAGVDPFETLRRVKDHALAVDEQLSGLFGGRQGPDELLLVGLPGRAAAGETGFVLSRSSRSAQRPSGGAVAVPAVAIAPSWLALAGYTVDDRMTGPVSGSIAPLGVAAERRRTRAAPIAASRGGERLEDDVMERLRTLGYVK